jgi:hypothetical protein
MRRLVSKDFRDLVLKTYPNLCNNKVYWEMMKLLMFGLIDPDTGLKIINYSKLAFIELGYKKGFSKSINRNYTALDFLLEFQKEVMDSNNFNWTHYSFETHQCRLAIVEFTIEIKEALEKEIYSTLNKEYDIKKLVYFVSGNKYNKNTEKQQRDKLKEEVDMINDRLATEEQLPLLNYLNNLPILSFSKVINEDNKYLAALEIAKIEDKIKREFQINLLASIIEDPKPLYQPSIKGNTVRIFPYNPSILMLKKQVRKALCKGWVEFDLASSQLAIVAETWHIQSIKDYLKSGNKIWLDLVNTLNVEYNDDNKKVLKEALYSIIFGKTKKNLVLLIQSHFGTNGAKLWLTHPIINTLLAARDNKINQITKQGKLTTIFNKEVLIVGKTKADKAACIRSALAQEAQAVEFYLMQPILDLALTTTDFVMTAFQHDGASIKFTDVTKQANWINRICTNVKQRADSLNIPTQLEIEYL